MCCSSIPTGLAVESLHYAPSASLAGSLRDHLRGFIQIDEPKRGFPVSEGARSRLPGIQYLRDSCCVFLSSANPSCDFHSIVSSHMVHVCSEELGTHLGGYNEGKAASQVTN